jgi:serine/threonine protein kinase
MPAELGVGTQIQEYRIESVLGRGGQGVVYVAEHVHLGRKVALKVLTPELAEDEGFRQRFVREARLAASLDHPNILDVYDAGEAEGRLFLAMRLVHGSDLRGLIRLGGPMPSARALEVLRPVASALDTAHDHGLVHRDVKPGNMLIEPPQGRVPERVFLSDFGLTKPVAEGESGQHLTRAGFFVGTPEYAAPEQMEGQEVDGRADQYSLACVLYECLAGQLPFTRASTASLIVAHMTEPRPSIRAVRPDLPEEVDAVLQKAMASNRADRYENCDDIFEALARLTATGPTGAPSAADEERTRLARAVAPPPPVPAPPPSATQPPAPSEPTPPAPTFLPAETAAPAAGPGGFLPAEAEAPSPERRSSAPEQVGTTSPSRRAGAARRKRTVLVALGAAAAIVVAVVAVVVLGGGGTKKANTPSTPAEPSAAATLGRLCDSGTYAATVHLQGEIGQDSGAPVLHGVDRTFTMGHRDRGSLSCEFVKWSSKGPSASGGDANSLLLSGPLGHVGTYKTGQDFNADTVTGNVGLGLAVFEGNLNGVYFSNQKENVGLCTLRVVKADDSGIEGSFSCSALQDDVQAKITARVSGTFSITP